MAPKIVFGATAGFGAIDGAAIHDRRRLEVSRFQFEIAFVFGSTIFVFWFTTFYRMNNGAVKAILKLRHERTPGDVRRRVRASPPPSYRCLYR